MRFLLTLTAVLVSLLPAAAQKKPTPAESKAPVVEQPGLGGLKFRSIGPAVTSGRIADFAVNPENPFEYYVATASGGVWKTVNGGTTYEPIFDSQNSYSIGCIALDPKNPNVVWVGSGENNNQRSVAYGDGIYRSEDGGASWKNMGLTNSEHIGRIIIHPHHPEIVYVAAIGPLWKEGGERGVYKTTDAGKTWTQILKIDDHTGVNDIAMDPRHPDILYASAHQRRRHDYAYISGGPGSAVYRTTDGGKTWEKSTNGLPSGDKGRIGLAVSPANPDYVYAIVEATAKEAGFYRSTNRGASWQKMSNHQTGGNYYNEVVADPVNPNRVYTMGYAVSVSDDGGRTFRPIGENSKHVDNHALWVNPKNTNHMINGCDGGIYETRDGARTWEFKSNLPVTQFYKVEVDNSFPFYYVYGGTQDNFSLGGPSRTINENGIVNSDWFVTNGGDGFESAIDPENPNIVYAQSQHGGLVRYDRQTGESVGLQPKPGKGEPEYRWNWDAPLFTSVHKKGRIWFAANKVFRSDDHGNTWLVVSGDVTRNLDRNALPLMGRVWGMDAVGKNDGTAPYGTVSALSESPFDENTIVVGTDDGLIQLTTDGGKNWTRYDRFPGIPDMTYVYHLQFSQHDRNVIYATFNNHKRGDFKPYILRTNDLGKTWTAIQSNLPERGSAYCLAEDFKEPALLFAGTEFGVHASTDGGKSWRQLKAGLPTIAVRDIALHKRETDVILATFGRGFYVLDDYSPLRKLAQSAKPSTGLFPVRDAWQYIERSPLGIRGKGFLGESYYQARNPEVGAIITWLSDEEFKSKKDQRQEAESKLAKDGKDVPYPTLEQLKAEQDEIAPYFLFTIKNEKGEVVRKLRSDIRKGVQRITWDMRKPTTSPVNLNPASNDNVFSSIDVGHLVAAGVYTVSMSKVDGSKVTELGESQSFNLKSMPGQSSDKLSMASLPATDSKEVAAWKARAGELHRAISAAGAVLSDAQNRVRHLKGSLMSIAKPETDFSSDLQSLEQKLNDLQQQLYGDNVRRRLDQPLPESIYGNFNNAYYDGYGSTGDPTSTMKAQLEEAESRFGPFLEQLKNLINNNLRQIEARLEAAGAPYTPGRMPDWKKN